MAMADIFNEGFLLHGIGYGVLKTVSGKVLELTAAQNMEFSVTDTTEDQYGGDSLFPLYTYSTQKEGTITITNADFSLAHLNLAQQTTTKTTGIKSMERFVVTKSGSTTTMPLTTATLSGVEGLTVCAPGGIIVPIAASAGTNSISVSATGEVEFGSSLPAGDYSIFVKHDIDAGTEAAEATVLKNAIAEDSTFWWTFKTDRRSGGNVKIDLYVPRCRANGEFNFSSGREGATSPEFTVKMLDPGDGRNDFMTASVIRL